jgi:hypothetical protein
LVVLVGWQPELLEGESVEAVELLGQNLGVEAPVFLVGPSAQVLQPPSVDDGGEVDEVAGLGAVEQRQDLVDGELLPGQGRPDDRRRLALPKRPRQRARSPLPHRAG